MRPLSLRKKAANFPKKGHVYLSVAAEPYPTHGTSFLELTYEVSKFLFF